MNNSIGNSKQTERAKIKKAIPFLIILLVMAITLTLFLHREWIATLGHYSYLGAFLVGVVSSSSLLLPMPGFLILIALSTTFNPVLIGLAGASGGIIGELTGYLAGYSGRKIIQDKQNHIRMEGWMKRWGSWAIFAFALFPVPVLDVAGIMAGALRFPVWKFLLIGWAGKSLKYIALLSGGVWGWEALLRFFS
ncbi:MAG: VTT domain-containing protein [Dehalococcoidales bacterium]|nr:VTT domain-containing protein [Dehalococcoidales bacterium]